MSTSKQISRRGFLGRAAKSAAGIAALSGPVVIPRSALGLAGLASANERLALGAIGCGGQGMADVNALLITGQVELAAVCDVFHYHAAEMAARSPGRVEVCKDFRAVLDRDDIDIVSIATPDHWHALIAIAACQAGKDIYCQKPLALTIEEGRAVADAARRHNRIVQVGSQQRSEFSFRRACELVRSGRIGKLQWIRVNLPNNPACGYDGFGASPAGLDWDMFLGPARWAPYNRHRAVGDFRWFWDYSGGSMTDWGCHHFDIVQWAMDTDHTGPIEIEGAGVFPKSGLFECPTRYRAVFKYKNGVEVRVSNGNGIVFHGSAGRIECGPRNRLTSDLSDPSDIVKEPLGADDVHLYESPGHYQNFIDCVRSRKSPICDAETGHRSATVAHLGNIAIRLGRKIHWDPDKEQIVGDEEASLWTGRPMRQPWHL